MTSPVQPNWATCKTYFSILLLTSPFVNKTGTYKYFFAKWSILPALPKYPRWYLCLVRCCQVHLLNSKSNGNKFWGYLIPVTRSTHCRRPHKKLIEGGQLHTANRACHALLQGCQVEIWLCCASEYSYCSRAADGMFVKVYYRCSEAFNRH